MKCRLTQLAIAALLLVSCSKHPESKATGPSEAAQLTLQKSSPQDGLVGTLKSDSGAISFAAHRVNAGDPAAIRDPDYANAAQAQIRDSRGVSIWGVGSDAEPDIAAEASRASVTQPTSQADIDLVVQLPNVLKANLLDVSALKLELNALQAAADAFRGKGGVGGPPPVVPVVPENAIVK
ncbi:MAG: hypothetical protein QM784_25620 [Polyangiaceae bacterium]